MFMTFLHSYKRREIERQAIADVPEAALYNSLRHLQAAEFLYETRLFPEHEYTFKHALTHEVAYGSLLQERRRLLHSRIVQALEALYAERLGEQVERLAHHALRGEVWDKALAHGREAGERAMTRSAHRDAVGYCEQALSALAHLPETQATREQAIDLRLALRSACLFLRDIGRASAYLHEAETLAVALDDPRRLGRVLRFLTRHFYFQSAHDQARDAVLRALALAEASGDAVLHALANQSLGNVYQAQGDYHRALDCFTQTMAFFNDTRQRERFGEMVFPAVFTPAWRAWCHAELGTFAEGRVMAQAGLRLAETIQHPPSLMVASWGLGLLAMRQGDLPRALSLLERAMDMAHGQFIAGSIVQTVLTLAAAYVLAGRSTEAMPLLTQAQAQVMTTDRVIDQAFCHLTMAEAHMLEGRLAEAQTLAEHVLAFTRVHQERGNKAYDLHLLGEIAAHRVPPDVAQATAHYQQALALAEELGMRPLQAHCHRGLGTLYAAIGRYAEARTALHTAIEMYTSMDMTFWLPQTETVLVQVEGQ